MLEMGVHSDAVHADLAGPLLSAGITHVWLAGPAMAHLRDALPESVTVEYREKTEDLAAFAAQAVVPGDAVMVKSSLGLGFGKIVAALLDKFPPLADTQAGF
jgi:UDP-N-acetylmuramoyl-tripeptide--D-alanyl-D-alanine ligase